MNSAIPIFCLIFFPALFLLGGTIILGLRHDRYKRELEHRERMKALELGRPMPGDEPWWSPAKLGLAFGMAVPISVFLFASTATRAVGYHAPIWVAAGVVGLAGVINGASIASGQFCGVGGASKQSSMSAPKPPAYDDAYDIVRA